MPFAFKLNLSVSSDGANRIGKGEFMGDDWASQFVARIAQKQQDIKDADTLLMHKRGMIQSEAPLLWDDLRGAINEKASSVNAIANYFKLTPKVQGWVEHSLESPTGHLSLVFQNDVPIIKFVFTKAFQHARAKPEQVKGELTFQVFDGSVWFTDKNGNRMAASEAAEFFLEMHS